MENVDPNNFQLNLDYHRWWKLEDDCISVACTSILTQELPKDDKGNLKVEPTDDMLLPNYKPPEELKHAFKEVTKLRFSTVALLY